jgi:hypothetical protein
MEEIESPFGVFSERLRGLATKQKVEMDRVEELEGFFKKMLEEKELDPLTEMRRMLGDIE